MAPEFDGIAHVYDSSFSQSAVGALLRKRVQKLMLQISAKTSNKVLELNCGTGEDAVWMAQNGWQVLATDASTDMVAIASDKIEKLGLKPQATARICTFADIAQIPESNFDWIFSNFGGLNCISPEELSRFGPVIDQKLKPGGKFIAVVMSRFCWWETLYFLLKLRPGKALRRLGKKPIAAPLNAQISIPTWYYSPSEFQKNLQISGKISALKPVGLWLPPSYLNLFFEKHPRLLRLLNHWELSISPSWLAFAGDHFWICIEKEP